MSCSIKTDDFNLVPGASGMMSYHNELPSSSNICSNTNFWYSQLGQLEREIGFREQEIAEIEKENKVIEERIQECDSQLKQMDYDVACLKYDLDKAKKEIGVLQVQLKKCGALAVPNGGQGLSSLPVPSASPSVEYILPGSIPSEAEHCADVTKEPQIFCKCGVQFTTKQNLREHIKYHTFQMNFRCSECGIRKHGMNQLRTHMRVTHRVSSTHLASLKGCRMCGQLFTSLAELHDHRRIEHGRKKQ